MLLRTAFFFALLSAVSVAADVPDVAKLLVDVIRINTTNAPGNEDKLAQFLKT